MGCNIPRPTKRPPTPSIDGLFGEKTTAATMYSPTTETVRRYNCPNCCAAITGPFCEYCGTVFERVEQNHISTDGQEFIIPIYIGNEQIDQVVRAFDEFHDVAHNIGR